jgi:hypothetical protein
MATADLAGARVSRSSAKQAAPYHHPPMWQPTPSIEPEVHQDKQQIVLGRGLNLVKIPKEPDQPASPKQIVPR